MNAAPPAIRLCGITKHFGSVRANHDISLNIRAGKIMALLGENGAGKSTLMSILSGKLLPDKGFIEVCGEPAALTSPKDALRLGIGMVYQHFMLVESMTVAENIILGQKGRASGGIFLQRRTLNQEIAALAERYGLALAPDARVHTLSMGEKQRVEIAKLLYRNSRVLIFDEPTAVLAPHEAESLFASMRAMAKNGKTIVFITHKMQEALDAADDIAILRAGTVADVFQRHDVPDKTELAKRMLGRERECFTPAKLPVDGKKLPGYEQESPDSTQELPPSSHGQGSSALTQGSSAPTQNRDADAPTDVVLEVEGLAGGGLNGLSFTLQRGEILAVVGVAGNGQKSLVDILTGLAPSFSGTARILGEPLRSFHRGAPGRGGLAYIPEDRLRRAVCPEFSLTENFLLTTRSEFSNGPWLSRAQLAGTVTTVLEAYNVIPPVPSAAAASFSGGNLQKFVIGRELYRDPAVIIAENPTQGLDIAAMEEIWRRLHTAQAKAGILLVTSDLSEAFALATRIAVMFQGKILEITPRNDADMTRIGLLMAGITP